ncbi:GNAT family N-acetyltransferase [bacterium SCSIO 12741]|nr:GNAT family N-acetyltransferase [bacterium SCSIO 12741]
MNQQITLRPFTREDAPRMAELANNASISQNMRNAFPHPYTRENALEFIGMANSMDPVTIFAIEADGTYVGNIGLHKAEDVYRKSAEIGYFIGEPFWNQGIASAAVKQMVEFGFETLNLKRIHAGIFDYNQASARVLEKCGFEKEGIARMAVFKGDQFYDELRYAIIKA